MLHSTLPQVLAGTCTVQPEHEGVLLLAALREEVKVLVGPRITGMQVMATWRALGSEAYLVVILHDDQGQLALLEVHFGDLRPGQREGILKRASLWPDCLHTTHSLSLLMYVETYSYNFV